ncbi:MAG: hypothetical protein ABR592_05985 [Nitriliruptorales bacterium]
MSGVSSAIPENLIRYGEQAAELDDRMLRLTGRLGDALDAFRASRGEFAPPIPELDENLHQLARTGRAMDEWVVQVGRAFAEADGGPLDRQVNIADLLLGPVGRSVVLPAEFTGEILDYIRDIAEWIKNVGGPSGPLGKFLENFPRHIALIVEEVTELYRHTRIVVEEVVDGVVRQFELSIDEFLRLTRWTGRTMDVAWLRRAAPWLRRVGVVGDVLTFPLAGWEQWEQDASRSDLTSTERALRAGVDGSVRGMAQFLIGTGTGAAAVALVPLGPPGWAAAGAVIVGGVVVGEVADNLIEDSLDWTYERYDWFVEDAAGVIDDSARWIGDRARDLGEAADDAQGWVGDRAEEFGGWVGDRAEDVGDAVDVLTPW